MLSNRDSSVLDAIFNAKGTAHALILPEGEIVLNPATGPEQEIEPGLLMQLRQLETDAVSLAEEKRYQQALELLTRAIDQCPTYASAYNNRAQTYRLMNLTKEALLDIEKAIELGGPSTLKQAYTQRAIIKKSLGDQTGSDEDFAKGAQFGNDTAKAMVKENPYAKLCNQMISEAMAKLSH
ncbi:Tetratricopeptide repeat protein 36 [Kappamyces sp. JEL0680]|nr:Tetratricopeptide repeat protein 36 [Kappamyces sp. JEL0680]